MAPTLNSVLFFLLMVSFVEGQLSQEDRFNFSYQADGFLGLFEGEKLPLVITILEIDPSITTGMLRLKSGDPKVFEVRNLTEINIESIGALPMNFTTVIEGIFLGITDLEIYYTEGSVEEGDQVGSFRIKVKNVPTILNPIFSYMTLAWLIVSYIMMGSKMKWSDLWGRIKKPWVLLLAMACQFVLMPLIAFTLSKAFRLDNETTIGLIMVGSCPGGWLSNIFSLLLDCDFILSLTMTFCSTILAMGMMPFNLWLYASSLTTGEETLETPFLDLFLQILYLVIPIGLSMLLARFSSKFRKYCSKLLKPIATTCILIAVGLGIPAQLHVYQSATVEVYIVSALLPLFGSIFGLIIAKIVCLERKQAITVSLETGAQNSLLAATMLAFFYPAPESDIISRVPYIMALLSMIEGIIVVVIYVLARYVFCKKRFAEKAADEDGDDSKEEKPAVDDLEKESPLKDAFPEKNGSVEKDDVTTTEFVTIGIQTNMPMESGDDNSYVNTAFSE